MSITSTKLRAIVTKLIFLVVLGIGSIASADTYTLNVRETVGWTRPGLTKQFMIDVHNITSDTIVLRMTRVRVQVPESWSVTFCTGAACFPDFVDSADYAIPPMTWDSLALDIYPDALGYGRAALNIRLTNGNEPHYVECELYSVVSVENQDLPTKFLVSEVYPNPFNSSTKLRMSLRDASKIQLSLFDAIGRQMTTESSFLAAGSHEIQLGNWFHHLPSGEYFLQIKSKENQVTHRIHYIR